MYSKAYKFFNESFQLIQYGNYIKAQQYLNMARFYGYPLSQIHLCKAIICLKKLRLNQAIHGFQSHLSLSHKANPWIYYYLGQTYFLIGLKKEAIQYFKKSFQETNDLLIQAKSLFCLKKMHAYSSQELIDITKKNLKYLVHIKAENLHQKRIQAFIFFLQGYFSNAISIFEKILQQKPQIQEPYVELAEIYMMLGDHKKAIHLIHNNKKLEKSDQSLLFLLAKAYYLNRNFSESKQKLLSLIKIFPDNPKLYFNLANTCYHLKQYHRSSKYYLKTLDYESTLSEAYFNLGVVYHKIGLLQQSQQFYQKTCKLNSLFYPSHYNLGFLFYQQKDYFHSLNSFLSAIQLNPNDKKPQHNFKTIKNIKLIDSSMKPEKHLLSFFNLYLVVIAGILLLLLIFF